MIDYYLITKPGILMGNLVTVAAGFLLASKGSVDVGLFFATLAGIAFIIASACIFNNYIDRGVDKKMQRTKGRALVTGTISAPTAIALAVALVILGNITLYSFTNVLTLLVADFGFFVYVVLYSLWKCHTVYGTAIGSIAGAVPPVVGYCAVSNDFDAGALIFFAMMILWQMPHFFSIALYHFDDYVAAGIPALPIVKGMWRTKVHMALYIAAFMMTAAMLTVAEYTGYQYLAVVTTAGAIWLWMSLKGFQRTDDTAWGKRMFQTSLLVIAIVCVAIPLDLR
jgi:protoheme IX farnesyltransferase